MMSMVHQPWTYETYDSFTKTAASLLEIILDDQLCIKNTKHIPVFVLLMQEVGFVEHKGMLGDVIGNSNWDCKVVFHQLGGIDLLVDWTDQALGGNSNDFYRVKIVANFVKVIHCIMSSLTLVIGQWVPILTRISHSSYCKHKDISFRVNEILNYYDDVRKPRDPRIERKRRKLYEQHENSNELENQIGLIKNTSFLNGCGGNLDHESKWDTFSFKEKNHQESLLANHGNNPSTQQPLHPQELCSSLGEEINRFSNTTRVNPLDKSFVFTNPNPLVVVVSQDPAVVETTTVETTTRGSETTTAFNSVDGIPSCSIASSSKGLVENIARSSSKGLVENNRIEKKSIVQEKEEEESVVNRNVEKSVPLRGILRRWNGSKNMDRSVHFNDADMQSETKEWTSTAFMKSQNSKKRFLFGHHLEYKYPDRCGNCTRPASRRCVECQQCPLCSSRFPCTTKEVSENRDESLSNSLKELTPRSRTSYVLSSRMDRAIYDAFKGNNNFEGIFGLISQGVDPNFQRTQADNTTALMAAASKGNLSVVQRLLELGSNPNLQDNSQRKAMDYSIKEGWKDVTTCLQKNMTP